MFLLGEMAELMSSLCPSICLFFLHLCFFMADVKWEMPCMAAYDASEVTTRLSEKWRSSGLYRMFQIYVPKFMTLSHIWVVWVKLLYQLLPDYQPLHR